MIGTWLDLPTPGVFLVLIVFYAATAAAVVWFAFGRLMRARVRRFEGVVAPYFGAVGILFALLTGFLAADIADRNRQAARAVQSEAAELRNVFTLSVASASDMSVIRAAWAAYLKAAIVDDWPAMDRGEHAPSAGIAYDALLREVSDPKIATEAGAALHAALLTAAVRIGTARSDRIAISSDRTNDIKWVVVLLLGVMTQVAIGLVHLQKRNAHIAALTVFSIAAVIALGLIGLQERPFSGDVRVEPGPLQEVSKLSAG